MGKPPVAVDVFGGAGGLSEGFLAAGINVAVAVEKHPHAALTHAFNHPKTGLICGDICELQVKNLLRLVEQQTGAKKVDIVAGGPPCQGFSPAGKQNERDPRNQLIHEFTRIVSELAPECFVFENVPAIADMANGTVINSILDDFWNLGYEIYGVDNRSAYYPESCPVVDSSWFGVPQKRKRLLLVGFKTRLAGFSWRGPSGRPSPSRRADGVTIEDAIGDLDFLKAGDECHAYRKKTRSNFQVKRRANSDFLFNHLASSHRPETVEMFKLFKPGYTVSSIPENRRTGKQRVRRFRRKDCSPAILALPDDYIHYSQHRIPTVRELARLQSFDDDYIFLGKRTTSDKNRRFDVPQYTQVGNAVPPLLARSLGRAIAATFGAETSDLRERSLRKKRQKMINGSSAYSGYTLSNKLKDQLRLLSIELEEIDVCFDDTEIPAHQNNRSTRWSSLQRAA